MKVILIGAGRYGNGLVGRKYKEGEFGAELASVVDPKINQIKTQKDYTLKDTPAYKNLEELPKDTYDKNTVAEIALIPDHIVETVQKIANLGIKKMILPKPVAQDFDSFELIKYTVDKNNIQCAVASNWHYSEITELLRAIINKTIGKEVENSESLKKHHNKLKTVEEGLEIEKVNIEYNKKREVLTIDPPSQEMPHALQIAYSSGLTDLDEISYYMAVDKQSKSRVNVEILTPLVKEGIFINSDLNMGDKLNKRRERTVEIFLNDEDKEPDIIADYDAQFNSNGICLKKPKIRYDVQKGKYRTCFEVEFEEDNLNTMYNKIFSYFKGEKEGEKSALTLEKYRPISKAICTIQELWEKSLKN